MTLNEYDKDVRCIPIRLTKTLSKFNAINNIVLGTYLCQIRVFFYMSNIIPRIRSHIASGNVFGIYAIQNIPAIYKMQKAVKF